MHFDQSNSSATVKRTDKIRSLKLLIARYACPQNISSDNAKTFTAATSWIRNVLKNETVYGFLEVKWKFNLSRVPWWVENLKD